MSYMENLGKTEYKALDLEGTKIESDIGEY